MAAGPFYDLASSASDSIIREIFTFDLAGLIMASGYAGLQLHYYNQYVLLVKAARRDVSYSILKTLQQTYCSSENKTENRDGNYNLEGGCTFVHSIFSLLSLG